MSHPVTGLVDRHLLAVVVVGGAGHNVELKLLQHAHLATQALLGTQEIHRPGGPKQGSVQPISCIKHFIQGALLEDIFASHWTYHFLACGPAGDLCLEADLVGPLLAELLLQ